MCVRLEDIIILALVIIVVILLVNWASTPPLVQSFSLATNTRQFSSSIPPKKPPHILYYFFHPTCGYCRSFAPEWANLKRALGNSNQISLVDIDGSLEQNENLAFYYNVTGYPTIILVGPNKNVEYKGNRTAADIRNFIMANR